MAISTLGFGYQGGGGGGGGAQGPAGANGAVWRNNNGVPSNSLGANGDYYLQNENGIVYTKVGGAYVPTAVIKGADGTNGTNGSVWYTGTGTPSPSPSYNANDFFLANDTGDVYQYNGTVWIPQTNIFGTDGTNGSVWYTGAGFPPPAGTYNPSDLYLDTDTNEVYQYDGTNWNQVTNIQGANGSQWYTASGVPTLLANDGDFYLDADDGEVWELVTGTWQDTGTNIKGTNGTSGTDGSVWYSDVVYPPPVGTYLPTDFYLNTTNGNVYQLQNDGITWLFQLTIVGTGIAGSVWFNGNGAPSTLEADGDYYLDNLTGDVYQQVSGSWGTPIANIKGVQGNNGTNGANSVNWISQFINSGYPDTGSFLINSPNNFASSQTQFALNVLSLGGNDQLAWLNAAKTLSDAFNVGYLQVTNQNDPTQYAVYQITSIIDVPAGLGTPNYFEINVAFFGGVDYVFNIEGNNYAFSYSFNGATGSVWYNGNGAPSTLEADGDYYLDNLTGDVYQQVSGSWGTPIANIRGAQGLAGQDGVSSSYFFYRTNTGVTSGSPTNQKVRWNQTAQITSTELGISTITDDAVDITIFLALLNVGDTIVIQDKNVAANYQTWLVDGTITDNTTWFSVPVTFVNSGGNGTTNFADNHPSIIAISREGAAGIDGANSQRYNYDPNTGGTPLAYSFTADGANYNLSTTFKFDYFNQGETDATAWWDALKTNFDINPSNNFLQIRTISNQAEMGSYLITQVNTFGTYIEIITNSALTQNGSFGTEVSVSYSLSGATGGGSPLTIQEEGGDVDTDTTTINFTGSGVTATQTSAGVVEVAIAGGGTPLTIQEEGVNVDTATTTINFTGTGVTATQTSAGNVQVAVSGGSGGFGGIVSSIRSLSTSTTLSPFVVGTLTIPYDGTITGWTIFSDVTGGCDVEYFIGSFGSYPPTNPLFTGGDPFPTLTSPQISNDATGLSIPVTKDEVLQCVLTAVSGAMTRIDVTLLITKS